MMPHTGLQILPCSRRIIQCLRRADVWKGPALVAPTWSWGLIKDFLQIHGGFHRWGYPKIDCFYRKFKKILSKWMIWGYPYFRKPPHGSILAIAVSAGKCSIFPQFFAYNLPADQNSKPLRRSKLSVNQGRSGA